MASLLERVRQTEPSPAPQDAPVSIIEPRQRGAIERAREVWRHRGLLRFFAARALQKTYGRTKLGRSWIFLRPLLDTGAKGLIFGGLLGASSSGAPYMLFFLCGVTIWTLFDRGLYWATRSLELNRGLVTKLYFPRLILPVATMTPAVIEFAIYGVITALAFVGYTVADGTLYLHTEPMRLLAAAAAVVMTVLLALSIALWTSVLGATARDVRFTLSYVLSFWFFITPVIYPLSQVPHRFRALATANPMTPIVELYKWGLLDGGHVEPIGLAYVGALIVVVATGGLWFFARAESSSVDRM